MSERATDGERFARHDTRGVVTVHHRDRVHDPAHDLGVGIDVGCGDVTVGPDHRSDGEGVAPRESLELAARESGRVHAHAALRATVRNVHDGALDRHVRRERGDLVGVDALVEPDAALARAARSVVLDSPAGVHLDVARVHAHGHRDLEDSFGSDDPFDHALVESEQLTRRLDEGGDPEPGIEFVRSRFVGLCDHVVTSLIFVAKADVPSWTSVGHEGPAHSQP